MNAGRIPSIFPLALLVVLGVLGSNSARAERPQPTSENKSLHEWANFGGFPILDPVPVDTSISPIRTPAPPMFIPVQWGSVDLVALLRSGTTRGSIGVSVTGYPAGDYTVSTVTESSSSTVVLGALTVTSGSIPPTVLSTFTWTAGHAVFGGKSAPFPAGFSPFDVASLSISDSNGNTVATTTLNPVPDGYYHALSPLAAGASAPGATGWALVRAETPPVFLPLAAAVSALKSSFWGTPSPIVPPIIIDPLPNPLRGPKTGQIVIHAQGLPPSETVTYSADGTPLGTGATDASGDLAIFAAQGKHRKLPATLDLFDVQSVTVEDGSGNVLVSAGF